MVLSTPPLPANLTLMATNSGTDRREHISISMLEQLAEMDAFSLSSETAGELLELHHGVAAGPRPRTLCESTAGFSDAGRA
jgi:hypothetical protein